MSLVLCMAGTGCTTGLIYTHITVPLDRDFHQTPVHQKGGRGDSWKRLVIPLFFTQGQVEVDWGDLSIAGAMNEAGIETVHYADLETLSVLGVWTQRWVHVYGE